MKITKKILKNNCEIGLILSLIRGKNNVLYYIKRINEIIYKVSKVNLHNTPHQTQSQKERVKKIPKKPGHTKHKTKHQTKEQPNPNQQSPKVRTNKPTSKK